MKHYVLAAFLSLIAASSFAQGLKVDLAHPGGLAENEMNQFRSALTRVENFVLSRNELLLKHIPNLDKSSISPLIRQVSVVVAVQPAGIHESTPSPALTLISSQPSEEEPSKPVDWTFVVRMKFFDPERTPKSQQLRAILALLLEANHQKHGLLDSDHISTGVRSEIQILMTSATDADRIDFE